MSALARILPALLAVFVVLGITLPPRSDTLSLHGTWPGTIEEPGRQERPVELQLPGRFGAQGLDPQSLAVVHHPLVLPDDGSAWAIHVDNVHHALAIRLDGELLGSVGEPEIPGPEARRHDGHLLVILPTDTPPGIHELTFTIRGDLYRGGIAGQIRAGPVETLLSVLQRESGSRMGFALTFALVGCLHLLGSTRRPFRWTEMLFGAFTFAVATYALEHSIEGLPGLTEPHVRHSIRRLFVSAILGFVVVFTHRFVYGRSARAPVVWLGCLGVLAMVAWLGPWWSTWVETVQDISLALVVVPWLIGMMGAAYRTQVPGSGWLLAALLLAAAGALDEALVTQGIIAGPRWMYPALCLFLLLCSLAIARQDRALSDRHRRLVNGSEDAMLEVSPRGQVLQLNPAAVSFLPGLAPSSELLAMVPPASRPLVKAHLSRAGTAPTRCEFALLDGRVVESVATPLDDTTRLLVMRDVTRRRRAEGDLVTAARVETAGILLGGVAHDLNNLLGAMLGHIGLLRGEVAGPAGEERLDRMEDVIERAAGVNRRLLAVGGSTHSSMRAVAVADLVRDVVEMAEPTLPESVELTVEGAAVLGSVHASVEDLRHVLLNLLLNARDAAGPQGRIQLRVERRDPSLVIEVQDSGPGVPAEIAERIWDPFFTTKGPMHGSGLGLPMARRLVRQHGGTLTYEGSATFRVTLPLHRTHATPVQHVGGARVAVVDDEEALRTSFAEALRSAGYLVDTYPDAVSALPSLVTEPPDALVTDVVMPGMSGLELALALRELQPDLPVLVVSGFVPASEALLTDGPNEQLDKPTRAEAVVEAVGRLLGSVRSKG